MNIFIPALGTKLKLNQPWSFTLYDETRNRAFWPQVNHGQGPLPGVNRWQSSTGQTLPVTLPPGTILQVDRIYIRKGNSNFDSVSFRIPKGGGLSGRFWAKLDDVNNGLDASIVP